jgi:hypothetical protein
MLGSAVPADASAFGDRVEQVGYAAGLELRMAKFLQSCLGAEGNTARRRQHRQQR